MLPVPAKTIAATKEEKAVGVSSIERAHCYRWVDARAREPADVSRPRAAWSAPYAEFLLDQKLIEITPQNRRCCQRGRL